MADPHPFSEYVRIIARGPNLSRPLTEAEMYDATRMILEDRVEPIQLGAFLCVLRVRTEDPGEAAGFVRAVKETIRLPDDAPAVDLDWSSYAGKKRQLPWFLLSARLLARNGVTILMHGTEGHTPDRIYAREALGVLGTAPAASLDDAAVQMRARNFAYLPLAVLSPRLQEIMELRPILGVRTPINTFTRMLNPFNAPYSLQSVFHPNYGEIHRQGCRLLGERNMAVFKGEGGEPERRPAKPVTVEALIDGRETDEDWPAMLPDVTVTTDADMDLSRLAALWRGDDADPVATAAVVGTAAIALRLMGKADSPAASTEQAQAMWNDRQPLIV
ncbi:MAG: glycosyl transferase family protein [Rhodospirillaceae bacterium]